MTLRFILKRNIKDQYNGCEHEHLQTLDLEVPELEEALSGGGRGENGYDITSLLGVEILTNKGK